VGVFQADQYPDCDVLVLMLEGTPMSLETLSVAAVREPVSLLSTTLSDMTGLAESKGDDVDDDGGSGLEDMAGISGRRNAGAAAPNHPAGDVPPEMADAELFDEGHGDDLEYHLDPGIACGVHAELSSLHDAGASLHEIMSFDAAYDDEVGAVDSDSDNSSSSSSSSLPGPPPPPVAAVPPGAAAPEAIDWSVYSRYKVPDGRYIKVVNDAGVVVGRLEPFSACETYRVGAVCFHPSHHGHQKPPPAASSGAASSSDPTASIHAPGPAPAGKPGPGGKAGRCSRLRSWKHNSGESPEMVDNVLIQWLLDAHQYDLRSDHMTAPRR
jgi:hypothetical protein